MIKNFNFNASDGENLKVTTYIEHACFSGNSIIFVHGFKGFKDWGFVPYVGEYFAKRGFLVLTFNFSHNGIGDILTEFTELEKFADNTFSREISELNEIISALKENSFENKVTGKSGLLDTAGEEQFHYYQLQIEMMLMLLHSGRLYLN